MRAILIILLMLQPALGATIHGTIYDFSLSKVQNAVIEINSSPNQQIVAKNGTYWFMIPKGNYSLFARHDKSDSEIEENITVADDGDYVFDLILLPTTDEDFMEDIPDVPEVESSIDEAPAVAWLIWLIVFVIVGFVIFRAIQRKEAPIEKTVQTDDVHSILKILDEAGGRMMQKDIRKKLPDSEAKVSLMIDELQAKGAIEKIKKGRGNLIIKK